MGNENLITEEGTVIKTEAVITNEDTQIESSKERCLSAEKFIVNNVMSFEVAATELKAIKAKTNELDAKRKKITKPMDVAKKEVMDFFREPLEYLSKAEKYLKQSMMTYTNEQERIRQIEEAKRQESARKEQERLRKRADLAAASGKTEKAEALEEQAEMVQAPVIRTAAPKVQGISMRETYFAEVVSVPELLQGVLDGKVSINVITVNMTVLNKLAVALKKDLNCPGVVVKVKKSIAARS